VTGDAFIVTYYIPTIYSVTILSPPSPPLFNVKYLYHRKLTTLGTTIAYYKNSLYLCNVIQWGMRNLKFPLRHQGQAAGKLSTNTYYLPHGSAMVPIYLPSMN